ncbi:glucose-6-phosphate isomerase [Taylorella equigenitalis]|uniref:Glucose-6-phosphate isomerase n=1 Tax=Taylorella equigenitalis ATCC 35865 TaxID=743973 RepID=A0ABM5NBI0_9BURK|nr:glucose-6-phosphate isomerase [Taylorella equigenitalis]AFN36318.1 glucose-6-phosphate isomerase [Taylorella equigenitalis ATCC 35865]ASY39718.1 glucose-6-phosphate isomerase [Taylorella equigenitalis]WFE03917.1 glucose-6-phosphate isomerase [Taylorella equigenitalis]WFE05397.1 glucose-6-phosphate isomerase [Taylorella equigenitalis]WFE11314.1 glucose-6-phosphate isomerase [Taylorella equigenitalis]
MPNSQNISTSRFSNLWEEFLRIFLHSKSYTNTENLLFFEGIQFDFNYQIFSLDLLKKFNDLLLEREFDRKLEWLFEQPKSTLIGLESPNYLKYRNPENSRQNIAILTQKLKEFNHIDTIIHIGVGGNYLGVKLVYETFKTSTSKKIIFVSSAQDINQETLFNLNPNTTLVIVASKSFHTKEINSAYQRIKKWIEAYDLKPVLNNVLAITNNIQRAKEYGIENHIPLESSVLGRFSLWSPISITLNLALGEEILVDLFKGASSMDRHFREVDLFHNIPIRMAMHSIANQNAAGCTSNTIATYDRKILNLPSYIQQLKMESLGKSVDLNGKHCQLQTEGTSICLSCPEAHHSYFQWLHQGMHKTCVDFFIDESDSDALETFQVQKDFLFNGTDTKYSDPHKKLNGGVCSTTISYKKLSPAVLGALISAYEHETYIKSVFWNINPFDQWGVDLIKKGDI